MGVCLKKELVFSDVAASSWEEILTFLGTRLTEAGFAKESFVEAIIRREKEFPTGLPTAFVGLAIPHANPENVNSAAFAIARLRDPVLFHNMGDPEETVEVKVVVMLCLTEDQVPIEVLSAVLEMFSQEEFGKKIMNACSSEELFEIINGRISKI